MRWEQSRQYMLNINFRHAAPQVNINFRQMTQPTEEYRNVKYRVASLMQMLYLVKIIKQLF